MAGKSPDRSEQQRSSGETTGKAETVPERVGDPRAALYESPREAAGTEGETDGDEEPSVNGSAAGKTAAEAGGEGEKGEEERGSGTVSADSADDTDAGDDADGAGSEDAGGTDGADDADSAAEESAAAPETGTAGTDGGGDADEDQEPGAEEPASGEPADQATAVFRVPASGTEDGAEETGDAEDTGNTEAAEDDQDVRSVRDEAGDSAEESGDKDGKGEDGRTDEGDEEGKSEDGPRDTADRGGTKAGDEAPVDQTTAMLRIRPGTGVERPGKDGQETDAERTSRFVPLRSDDIPLAPGSTAPSEQRSPSGLPESERTRQQPLPPTQRPLDLLAELTNKPAPPETPLRVAVRRIKIWSPLVLLLVVVLAVAQFLRPLPEPELRLTASATHTFDGARPSLVWPSEGQAYIEVEGLGPLGSYGEQKPVPIASVAKVMTAYVILRDHPLKAGEEGPKIAVDRQAEEDAGLSSQGESTVQVKKGEQITLHEALNALMIASANNVARLLARWDAGSEKAFVAKMNEAAEELGMKDTTYTDPSGLRRETVSTARDQVELGKKVMDYEVFRNIVKLPSYVDRNGDKHDNWNRLIPYDNSVGIKTGTSTAAGGNLLFAAEKQIGGTTQLIVGAVFGQHRPPIIDTVVSESRKLMLSAQDVLETEKIVEKGDVVGHVDDGLGGRTPLVAAKDVTAVGWPGLEVELALTDGGKGVPHEAAAGETVGTLTVGSGPGQVKVPVAVQEELTKPGAGARLTRIL